MQPAPTDDRILIVLPLPLHRQGSALWIEPQAASGLEQWLVNFRHVTLICPLSPERPPAEAVPLSAIDGVERLSALTLPMAYTPLAHVKALPQARRLLTSEIARARHLHFAIGGMFGDWGAFATLLAHRAGRRAAIWTDLVESDLVRLRAASKQGVRRFYNLLLAGVMARFERHVVRRAALGLFHGMDTFTTYGRYSPRPLLVHDIHVDADSCIRADAIDKRLRRSATGPLRIAYAGRLTATKGIADWIEVLGLLHVRGIDFQATWYGNGPERDRSMAAIATLGLQGRVILPGVLPHREVLTAIADADIFLFCHKALESPRCLIEALMMGVPIMGYDSPYPRDLLGEGGGGVLTPKNDVSALAEAVQAVHADRTHLATLTRAAASAGTRFSRDAIFRHRAEVMRSIL